LNVLIISKALSLILLGIGAWLLYRMIDKEIKWYAVLLYLMPIQFIHAYSGMETILFGTLIIWAFHDYHFKKSGYVPLILLCLVRPEGIVIAGAMALFYAKRKEYSQLLVVFVTTIIYLAFKYAYYGAILPQSYAIKENGITAIELIVLGVVWIYTAWKHKDITIYISLILALFYVGYYKANLLMGYADRFYVPLLGIAIFAVFELTKKYSKRLKPYYLVLAILFTGTQLRVNIDWMKEYKVTISNLEEIGKSLKEYNNVVAWDIGATKFYSKANVIDMVGLTDKQIGSGKDVVNYVYSKKPDAFALPSKKSDGIMYHKYWLPELLNDPRFKEYKHINTFKGINRHYHVFGKN